jgi:hypothetical protein
MQHDFKKNIGPDGYQIKPYVYRKYESESKDCRGLMDYIDDGVGWSACSARDFSRYITNGGSSKSCLTSGNLIQVNYLYLISYFYCIKTAVKQKI